MVIFTYTYMVHSWQHPLYVMCLIFSVLDTVQFRVTSYLEHMLEAAYGALEGLNKQAFMTELVRFSWSMFAFLVF